MQFQSDGNLLLLEGDLRVSESSISDTSASEFIIKDSSGTIVAKIHGESGDFLINGIASIVPLLTRTTTKEFIVRNFNDASGDVQILIDANGNLKLRGDIFTDDDL